MALSGHRPGCRCVGCSPATRARGMRALRANPRPRVALARRGTAFVLGKRSPFKGRVRAVNPRREVGVFEHEGRQFSALGAVVTPTHATGYPHRTPDGRLVMRTWNGEDLGPAVGFAPVRRVGFGGVPFSTQTFRAFIEGRWYSGTGSGLGMLWRGRVMKRQPPAPRGHNPATPAARKYVSREISLLERGRGYSHPQAVATALAMARKAGYRSVPLPEKRNPAGATEEALTYLAHLDENTDRIADEIGNLGALVAGNPRRRPAAVTHGYAYRAGYSGLLAAADTRGTPNLSPSLAEREYWSSEWGAFLRGWQAAKKAWRPNPLDRGETAHMLRRQREYGSTAALHAGMARLPGMRPEGKAHHREEAAEWRGRAWEAGSVVDLFGVSKPGRGVRYMFRQKNNPGAVEMLIDGYTKKPAPFRAMTLDEIKRLYAGSTVWFRSNDGTARRAKVNGAVRQWKRDPDRVEVPLKYGMYEYGTFDTAEALRRLLIAGASNPLTRRETHTILREARGDERLARASTRGGSARGFYVGRADRGFTIARQFGVKPRRDRYLLGSGVSLNPPRVVGTVPGGMSKIYYNRTGKYAGPYVHKFSRGVRAYRLSDGSVLLRGRKPLWVRQD